MLFGNDLSITLLFDRPPRRCSDLGSAETHNEFSSYYDELSPVIFVVVCYCFVVLLWINAVELNILQQVGLAAVGCCYGNNMFGTAL